ncbi:MAG: MoxR family ATPase [Sulfolobales archaeon]
MTILKRILDATSEILIEREYEISLIVSTLLSSGHALMEGVPGIAKTLTAKTIARLFDLSFKRIQMTPDLLPADILGSYVYNQRTGEFILRKGPIFANIVLVDEINRGSPRTQSALLEAMQERQVTIEGETIPLEEPFMIIATQNPIEFEGVFPLPEAQVDRFLVKITTTYPSTAGFIKIMSKIDEIEERVRDIKPVISREELLYHMREVRKVRVDESIYKYVADIVEATRRHPSVRLGGSPRAGIALIKIARSLAYIDGRNYVIPDDIKKAAKPVMSHRIILKSEYEVEGVTPEAIIDQILSKTPVPKP